MKKTNAGERPKTMEKHSSLLLIICKHSLLCHDESFSVLTFNWLECFLGCRGTLKLAINQTQGLLVQILLTVDLSVIL